MSDNHDHEDEMTRRDFLGKLATGSIVGAGAMAFIGVIQLPLPKVFNEAPSVFKIGYPSDFQVNTYKTVPQRNVFVLRDEQGFRALSAICTHLGCIVSEVAWGFQCPCHGSKFNKHGDVIGGPAPKALEWLKVSMSPDGQLTVDAGKKVKRDVVYVV